MRKRPNTSQAYLEREKTGRGTGFGKNYQPWLRTSDVTNSNGSRFRFYSRKCGRIIHVLSNSEAQAFLAFDWDPAVVEIYEQYPLDPIVTGEIAKKLNVRHPGHSRKGGFVMTTDFLVRYKTEKQQFFFKAFQVKSSPKDTEPERTAEKLAIEQAYWEQKGVSWSVVYASDFNRVFSKNLLTLAPHRNAPFSQADLAYLMNFFRGASDELPDVDSTQLAEAVLTLPGGSETSGWEAVLILAGHRLIEAPISKMDLFDCTLKDFGVSRV